MGGHSLLQGSFPTQGSNPGLLHCKQVLYCPSHSPGKPDLSHRASAKYRLLRKVSRTGGASKTKSQSSRECWRAGSCGLRRGRPSPPLAPGPLRLPPTTPAKWSPGPFFLLLSAVGGAWRLRSALWGRGQALYCSGWVRQGCTLGSHLQRWCSRGFWQTQTLPVHHWHQRKLSEKQFHWGILRVSVTYMKYVEGLVIPQTWLPTWR